MQRSLKLGVNLNCTFSVEFRVDVFNFLFKGKGRAPPAGHGLFYELNSFTTTYFPVDWHVVYIKLGDGGNLVLKPRTFTEMVYVRLVKCRC